MPESTNTLKKSIRFTMLVAALFVGWLIGAPAHASTSYRSLIQSLRIDSALRPNTIHLYQIGESATKQRGIWLVRLSSPNNTDDFETRPRILFICRQHGDEPASSEAALRYVDKIARETPGKIDSELGSAVVYLIPMANPDGADALTRLTGVHADLNRDWGKFTQPETRAIYAAFKDIAPSAVIDIHSWTPGDSFLSDSVEVPAGDSSSSSLISTDIDLQMKTVDAVQSSSGDGVTAFSYAPTSDLTLCHRFFASKQHVVSMLVETAMTPTNTKAMPSQIGMVLSAMNVVVRSTQTDPAEWRRVAKLEGMEPALDSPLLEQFGDMSALQVAKIKFERLMRKSILESVAAYSVGVLILICFLWRPMRGALLRLLSSIDVAVPEKSSTYIPVRRRHTSILTPPA